jgi:phosphate transport system substrate-binding protein
MPPLVDEWTVRPVNWEERYTDFFTNRLKTSQTHGAFMNLIDGNVDIILTHRTLSPDEKRHADEVGVTLLETPVAMDAFVFVVNKDNPVKSLTVEQVQKIYTGEITRWAQVGGSDEEMKVYTRPRNSGSEEVMRELVMKDLEMADFPESAIGQMVWVFKEVMDYPAGICYTFNNYKELIARKTDEVVPKIAVNGIFPDENTVRNRTYPFISEVHVAIRSDVGPHSMAYKLYEWLQTSAAEPLYTESGFVPKTTANGMPEAGGDVVRVYPNPVSEGFYIEGLPHPVRLTVSDISGRMVFSQQVSNGEYVDIRHLPPGVYVLQWATGAGRSEKKIIKQ